MKGWMKLLISILFLWAFVALVPDLLMNIKMYREIQQCSELNGLDNSALIYSEEPVSYRAEKEIKNKLKE
jgi:hypothetical protein